ncbi:phosphatase PAP2 family protein [Cohnella zeiphila]|uniref:Phosphatase PAP2 family protein n=1 Tax=Cohnella zeiphila TaxID=2761120 RepID=A0A7X0SQK9_9BACL|nr:phosphatase PAP2 family protein [Cohnella zeiphila]
MGRLFLTSRWASLSLLLTVPLLSLIYLYVNRMNLPALSLETGLDRRIPFVPAFILPYLGWFAFLLAAFVYLAFRDRRLYLRTLLRFDIGLLACYVVYLFCQTTVPRPVVADTSWLNHLVLLVYRNDEPVNCFPSTHVLTSYCLLRAYLSSPGIRRPIRYAVAGSAILIILSTLFVKQHVLLDAVGAIALVEAIYALARPVRIAGLRLLGRVPSQAAVSSKS